MKSLYHEFSTKKSEWEDELFNYQFPLEAYHHIDLSFDILFKLLINSRPLL